MSTDEYEYVPGGARRAKKKRSPVGWIVGLVVVALVVAGLYVGAKKGAEFLDGLFGEADDYPGPGTGEVLFAVESGDTAAAIGRGLKDAGVVASVEAFINEANADSASSGIQVGTYSLMSEMSARGALEVLLDPKNQVKDTVTVPEGLRVVDVVEVLAERTEFSKRQYEKALDRVDALGLPDYADGNAEGYLFPATYEVRPDDKPVDVLARMVARWRQAADEAGLEQRAAELGRTPGELMTIASLVEAEGRGDDMPKISRVIWNRLEGPGSRGGTNGLLQIDAAVNYALDRKGTIRLSTAEIDSVASSPYNTYKQVGLPPTPINSPGDAALDAAANPVDGPWYYYVTVNLATGETKFAEDYDEFLTFKAEYNRYCETSDAC